MHVKPSWDAQCIAVPDPMHQNVPQSISNKGRHIFVMHTLPSELWLVHFIWSSTSRVAQIQIQKEFRIKRQLNILIQIQKHIQLLKHKNIFDTLPSGLCQCTLYDRRSLSQSCAGCLARAPKTFWKVVERLDVGALTSFPIMHSIALMPWWNTTPTWSWLGAVYLSLCSQLNSTHRLQLVLMSKNHVK